MVCKDYKIGSKSTSIINFRTYAFICPLVYQHFIIATVSQGNFITLSIIAFFLYTISWITWCIQSSYKHSMNIGLSTPKIISFYSIMVSLITFWRSPLDLISSWYMLKISHLNTFYFLIYTHVTYVKSLFINIQKKCNMLETGLYSKKFTNLRENN